MQALILKQQSRRTPASCLLDETGSSVSGRLSHEPVRTGQEAFEDGRIELCQEHAIEEMEDPGEQEEQVPWHRRGLQEALNVIR